MLARGLRLSVVAAALLMAGALPSVAQAAAPSTVQVRVSKHLKCSGTVVASRFVLTARHCIKGKRGKFVKRTAVQVVTKARKGAFLRVAAFHAPKPRSLDLVLLELTSTSHLGAAKLATPAQLRKTRTRRAAGWTSTKRIRRVKGKTVNRKGCRSGSASVCLSAGRKPIGRRCSDQDGAVLTVSLKRKTYLAGVGTRSRRGCLKRKKSRRYTFLDVTRSSVAKWIAATVAPKPVPLQSFVGRWRGTVQEDDVETTRSYQTTIAVTHAGAVGTEVGRSNYSNGCGGNLSYLGAAKTGGVSFRESLNFGQSSCIDGGTVTLTRLSGPAFIYSWQKAGVAGTASGVLVRLP